jgi:acetyltransferase-like isoleucine patch superfamily enzyme
MKSIVISILGKIISQFRKFKYLILPNLFTKTNYSYKTVPCCQQRTEFTGRGIVNIGKNCVFGYKIGGFWRNGVIEIQARYKDSIISIGNQVHTNNNIFICCANSIRIGDKTLIGQYVTIMDFEAHGIDPLKRNQIGEIGSISIGHNVWIGNNVTILKNTIIGNNSIVAAGAVVSGNFPENVVIGGVPAKIIKSI